MMAGGVPHPVPFRALPLVVIRYLADQRSRAIPDSGQHASLTKVRTILGPPSWCTDGLVSGLAEGSGESGAASSGFEVGQGNLHISTD
jgi:hypothetical protein